MQLRFNIVFILLFITASGLNASGGVKDYLVLFEEGFYEKNKMYRARVTVYMNGKKLTTKREIKGSTLPNRFIYCVDKNRPVVATGEHRFDVSACDRFGKALLLNHGGYVQTLNPNPTKHGDHLATGIWIHSGRSSGPVKGSHGCLTIAPKHWKAFIALFPGPKEWKDTNCKGKIAITRRDETVFNGSERPVNLRILREDRADNDVNRILRSGPIEKAER